MTSSLRVGVADHFGWAIVVTATAAHEVVDRRRIDLVEPGVCEAPIHYESHRLSLEESTALVAAVRASVRRATSAALSELAGELPAPVGSLMLRVWPPDFPTDIEVQRRSPWEARADAVMYRQVLADAAAERDWAVHGYEAKGVEAAAAARLGERADVVLRGPRATLGPPWGKDHRVALAATVVLD